MKTSVRERLHFLLIPAIITLLIWVVSRKRLVTPEEQAEARESVFDALVWIMLYAMMALVIIREITIQVPIVITTY